MKNILIRSLIPLILLTSVSLYAQVGIGTTSPAASSMLDIASSAKGMLAPRMTSIEKAAIATPASGLLVYDTTLGKFSYFTGSAWVNIDANIGRDNYVLVKSATDFPAAVGGVITLAANTLYEINGSITLTSKIDLNNSMLIGIDWLNDKLIYTPSSGELFTGTHGGIINGLTLTAATAGAKLFNLDAGGAAVNLIVYQCFIVGCNDVGLIKGFDGNLIFQTIKYVSNVNGITFQNISNLHEANVYWESNNSNTYEKFIGMFNQLEITGGDRNVLSANSAIALDVSGITSITTAGELKAVLFTGTGTFVSGTFSNKWEVEAYGLNTEKDDVASGNIYISSSAETTIATKDIPVKIAGITTAASLFRVTMPNNNRLAYIGTKTRRFQVIVSLTASAAAKNRNFSFHIFKNGSKLPESTQSMKLSADVSAGSLTLSCTLSLATNDYLEVWTENNTDNLNITVDNLNFSIK